MAGPMRILDVDAMTPGDIGVKLGGDMYRIPGDLPVPLVLRLIDATEKCRVAGDDDSTTETMQGLHDIISEILSIRSTLPIPDMGFAQCLTIAAGIIAELGVQEVEEEKPTPRPPTRRAKPTTRKPRS